jgi:hypothetical protein
MAKKEIAAGTATRQLTKKKSIASWTHRQEEQQPYRKERLSKWECDETSD